MCKRGKKQKITLMQKAWHSQYIPNLKIVLLILRHIQTVIKLKVNPRGKGTVTVINAYAPKSSTEDEKV